MSLGATECAALEALPALPPAVELATAYKTVHAFFMSKLKNLLELSLPTLKELRPLQNDLIWAYSNSRPPTKLNAELEGALLVLLTPLDADASVTGSLLTTWLARGGWAFALQSLVKAHGAFTTPPRVEPKKTHVHTSMLVPSQKVARLPLHARLDVVFRAELSRATEEARQVARAEAVTLRGGSAEAGNNGASLSVRSVLSSIFLEPEWLDADLRERVESGRSGVFTPLSLLHASDGGGVARFFSALTSDELAWFAPESYDFFGHKHVTPRFANALLERFPDGAPLTAWMGRAAKELRDVEPYARFASASTFETLLAVARTTLASANSGARTRQGAIDDEGARGRRDDGDESGARGRRDEPALAAAEGITRGLAEALTALQDATFSKDQDPRPELIALLRSVPKTAAAVVKEAAARKAKWAVTLAPQFERASESAAEEAPAAAPKPGAFWLPASFTPLETLEGRRLTAAEVEALGRALRRREAEAIAQFKGRCTRASLAAFSWDLFSAWLAAGTPSTGRWALQALGDFGDDETARKLTPLIRQWPGESAHARAVTGLEVLAAIGTDTALRALDSVAQRVRFRGLQDNARELMGTIAQRRGLSTHELGDRLIPDGGLGADGTLTLSFGERSFRAAVDSKLVPYLTADTGRRLADLPKKGTKDDPTLAARSTEAWKELKQLLKTEGATLLLRFELAMAEERRWSTTDFKSLVLAQPLLVQLVRSVLWGRFSDDGKLLEAFRVGPKHTPVRITGEPLELSASAQVGLVHPLLLTEDQAAVLSDALASETEPPFEQLARKVFTLGAHEWETSRLDRYEGRITSAGKLRGLRERGWRLGPAQDAGVVHWLTRNVGGGTVAGLLLEDGFVVSGGSAADEVQLGSIVFGDGYDDEDAFDPQYPVARKLDTRSKVMISELLRDLDAIVQSE